MRSRRQRPPPGAGHQTGVVEPEDGHPLQPLHEGEEQEAHEHQDQDHGERVVHGELVAELLDEHPETPLGGDELTDDGADQRQACGGLQPGEHDGQGAGDDEPAERLPATGAQRPEHLARLLVDGQDVSQFSRRSLRDAIDARFGPRGLIATPNRELSRQFDEVMDEVADKKEPFYVGAGRVYIAGGRARRPSSSERSANPQP